MTDTVIFDLDGTLLNTLDDLHTSVNHALVNCGFKCRTREEIRQFLGNGVRELIRCSLPDFTEESTLNKVLECFRQYYLVHNSDQTRPYEGIMDMLTKCKELGYRTAIVSNKPDFAVQELYHSFFSEVVDVAIGEKPGIPRKPSPEMVHKAVDMLGSALETSVYVGDSEVDIATAKNSGMRCISVSWGFRDKSFLVNNGAETIIDMPEELFDRL